MEKIKGDVQWICMNEMVTGQSAHTNPFTHCFALAAQSSLTVILTIKE